MDEFNFKPAQYCISEIFELTKSCIWAISNECNKVIIELRVEQFLSYLSHTYDFKFTRVILAQIVIHSVQLPLCSVQN